MRPKKFLVSAINSNSIKVYDAVSQQLQRIIPVSGVIKSAPISEGNSMEVTIEKNEQTYKEIYALPNGNLISSQLI